MGKGTIFFSFSVAFSAKIANFEAVKAYPTMLKQLPTYLSRALSMALHPLVMPLYLVALLFTQTSFALFPLKVKWYLGGAVVLYGTLIPILVIGVLRYFGKLSNLHIHNRRERTLLLGVGMVAYLICAFVVAKVPQADFLRKFVVAAACCELLCLVVSSAWKISLFMTSIGAAVALFVVMNTLGMTPLFPWLIGCVLAAGLLASARLYLGYHNPWQVLAGFMAGFVIMMIALLFL